MTHLRLCMNAQFDCGDKRHAQAVMRDLGITYRYAVPQSLGDQWWFLDCQNVPAELPAFITPMVGFDAQGAVGYGLSQAIADALTAPKQDAKESA
jgi:hypothetical protein